LFQVGHVHVVSKLLQAGAKANVGLRLGPLGSLAAATPLSLAVFRGHTGCVSALLRSGASPSTGITVGPRGALMASSPLSLLTKPTPEYTRVVRELLRMGASPHFGMTFGPRGCFLAISPLFGVACDGHEDSVLEMLQAGALPHKGLTLLGFAEFITPLSIAAKMAAKHADRRAVFTLLQTYQQ
jgi:hypothetical protein